MIARAAAPVLDWYAGRRRHELCRVSRDGEAVQEAVLVRLVSAARDTEFGLTHGFSGIRSVADARALSAAGVERVVVGTAAFGPTPLEEFVDALGEHVAVAIDVAGGIVRTAGWRESSELTTADALDRCTSAGVATVVCTAIDRDGTRTGPDLELLCEARDRFGGRVLAAGGIRDAADVEAIRELGLDGVVVGRAWLDGTLSL